MAILWMKSMSSLALCLVRFIHIIQCKVTGDWGKYVSNEVGRPSQVKGPIRSAVVYVEERIRNPWEDVWTQAPIPFAVTIIYLPIFFMPMLRYLSVFIINQQLLEHSKGYISLQDICMQPIT